MAGRMHSTERSTRSSRRFLPEPAPAHEPQIAHTDTGQYMCIECGETFNNKIELNSHRQSHVTKKQFTCSHCGRGFHHQVFLQMHERSHEDGISPPSLTKMPASRVISTRSRKPSLEADIIHVTSSPSKSLYHLNSKVEFKREWKVSQDVTPRECVTRRTQGTYSPPRQRIDSSDKNTQFELRISKLSDSTVHLIDPFGNTLEILAEVFNTYTIGEHEEESVSPSGETSAAPTSSSVHVSAEDKTTDITVSPQDSMVLPPPQAEISEPLESINDGVMEEDLPLCCMQSVSSASVSPKTVPVVGENAEDVVSTQSPPESDTRDVTCNEPVDQPPTEIPKDSTEEEILSRSVKDSLTPCDDQTITEGAMVCDDLSAVTAQTDDLPLKLCANDYPSLAQEDISEVLHGGHHNTKDSPTKPASPEPRLNVSDEEKNSDTPLTENEKGPSMNVATSRSEEDLALDLNEDKGQLVTPCVMDSQELKSDCAVSLSDTVNEDNMLSRDRGLGVIGEVVLLVGQEKKQDVTLEDETTTVQSPFSHNECESETDEHHKESVEVSSTGGYESDSSAANKVCTPPVDSAEDGSDGNQTASKSELEPTLSEADICRLSQEVTDETSRPLPPDVCSSEPDTLNITSVVMSLDIPGQRTMSSSDHEGSPIKEDIAGNDLTSLEKSASQPIVTADTLSQIVSGVVPILLGPEPPATDGQMEYKKTDLLINDPSQKSEGSSEPNPDSDPCVSSPLHDLQPSSSHLEQDVNLGDEEMEADVSVSCTENEEKPGHIEGEVSGLTPVCSLDIQNPIDEALSQENIQKSAVEKIPSLLEIPVVESAENSPICLLEPEELSAGDVLLPPCDKDSSISDYTETRDVSFNVQTLASITSAYVKAQERILSQETKPTEQDAAASMKSDEKFSTRPTESANLKEDALFEKLEGEDPGTTLCLLEQTLDLSPDLEDLSDKCILSSDDVKDLVEPDIDKNLSSEDPDKQYIQMSNANLTENDLADDFVDSGTVLLDGPSLEEATKGDDISAISVDEEGTVHELSDILLPEVQESEYPEGPDDKHAGFGGQCLKCGRRVRRGRKELVWFPICYKCRLKAKREERHAGEGTSHSPDFVLETGLDSKKGSSDFSNFCIKQETDSAQDNAFYRTVKPAHSIQSIKQESAALLKKMYKCPKCEKSFRIPALLAGHMKCHSLPQCLTCGCPMTLKYKTKRIPKRCHKCFQKIKQQKKEERPLCDAEDDSLDSDSGSLFVDDADLQSLTDDNEPENDSVLSSTKLVEDPKPGSVKRGTEPFHSIFMRKRKQMNPAIQALYCTCDIVLKSGAKQPKICKNCQKPVRDRLVTLPKASFLSGRHVHGQTPGGKVTQLKKTKKQHLSKPDQLIGESSMSRDNELSADEFCKEEEIEPFTDLDISDQVVPPDGEKPRLCPQCGKIFKCNRSLNLHLLSHTATQCESCGCRLQKKKRAGRWSKKCRVCRLLTKDKGLPDGAIEEVLLSDKIPKAKNVASLRMKMKQSKIVRSRKIQSIAKHKKDLKWMNMILAVKGLPRKPRKKKEQSLKSPSEEKSDSSSEATETDVYSGTEEKSNGATPKRESGSSGLPISQKKILGGVQKVNRKCMYREKNIIKVEEPLSTYIADPSSTPVSVKEEEENQCLECNEIFPSFDLLLSHQQGHVDDQPFTCSQCPQRFSTEQYLSIHISAHAEGPPFRCPECNKTFTRRNHLGVHRRVHTGSRPFACPDCPCRFRQRGSLIIHRYTHRNLQFMLLKPYQCSICNKSFKQKERLVIHERLHTGECPFSCKDCDKVFPSKSRLYVHRKMHKVPEGSSVEKNASCKEESGGQPFKCKDCDKVCSTKASFVLHRKVHKSSAVLEQSSSQKENLEETTSEMPLASGQNLDIKTEPEGHPFSCKDCGKVCSTKASFVLHRKMHRLDRRSDVSSPFVCRDCDKVCSTKASLVLHRKVHKSPLMCDLKANIGDPPYICQACNKVCSTKASFVLHSKVHKASSSSEHVLKTTLEQKSFVCKDCGFVCSTKASFVLHRKVHRSSPSFVQNLKDGTGEHPFTCKDCDKVCSTKASFVLHCKVHKAIPGSDQSLITPADVEEKPYHCKECGKIYSTKGRLLSHMKLHTGQDTSADSEQLLKIDTEEKPFACPICHMRFTRLKILVRHKLIHGEDVLRCGHCGKRFLFQKSLMNHVPVCLKRSKGKTLLGKEKVPKKRKSKDGSNEESAPKKRKNENKKAVTTVQKIRNKKLIKAKKLAMNKEKSKAKSSQEKKPKKPKGEAEQDLESEGEKQSDGKQERLLENVSKEKEIGKDKKPKDVGKVKKVLKKVPPKQKRQKVSSNSLKKWRIIAAATVKKRKLQAVISGGKKKVTVKKKGPNKAKTGGKNSKE